MKRLAPTTTRWKALGATLMLGASVAALTIEAASGVPLPKPRPISRNVVPATTAAIPSSTPAKPVAADQASRAPAIQPATRQHAALPAPTKRAIAPAAMAATSSTPQADAEAVENVIELIRNRKPVDASQVAQGIGDPVARKLAEWLILRSDNNGASVERYRAFLAANPSWPSQTFLRRRAEAALWDDRRNDDAVLAYFQDEKPLSAKGKFSLARAMIARGDRAQAERLVRDAWRNDSISGDTEAMVLDLFGALLSGGDHKARMDMLLYGSDTDAALRAAQRLGGGQMALARAHRHHQEAAERQGPAGGRAG